MVSNFADTVVDSSVVFASHVVYRAHHSCAMRCRRRAPWAWSGPLMSSLSACCTYQTTRLRSLVIGVVGMSATTHVAYLPLRGSSLVRPAPQIHRCCMTWPPLCSHVGLPTAASSTWSLMRCRPCCLRCCRVVSCWYAHSVWRRAHIPRWEGRGTRRRQSMRGWIFTKINGIC